MSINIQFNNRTVGEILTEIRADSSVPREQGTRFENLFRAAAPHIAELQIEKIWRWADWDDLATHGYTAQDFGIDLVAETAGGKLVAIQCKCYADEHKVGKEDVKDFIVAINKDIFPLRWFVATSECSAVAEKLLAEHDIRTIDFHQYEDLKLTDKAKPSREPWALQSEAIEAVTQGFEKSGRDRGRLIMACGTGKTFTALRIAERIAPGTKNKTANILFIAPSIALVAQNRREWLNHTKRKLACTVICSDKTAGKNSDDIRVTEISCETTTDPEKIAADLTTAIPKGAARAVFCTYQSLAKLQEAQHKHGAPDFDLALIDEAHRTTGYLDESRAGLFQLIHDPQKIRAKKRLYMTATPRIYETKNRDQDAHIVDMNDEEIYGREFYRLGFKKAVEAEMLCDYRVIALGITEDSMDDELKGVLMQLNDDIGGKGKAADAQAFLALGAIALAVNGIVQGKNTPGVLPRTIAFASNIRRSMWLAGALEKNTLNEWLNAARLNADENTAHHKTEIYDIQAKHLDGTSSALQRNAALRELNTAADVSQPHLISNAQLFTEGVDVPALNAIAFLDPRQSKVDTIQAVGRVMRRDSGKSLGYIIVPVILPPDANLIDTLNEDQSRFKTLGAVLRALQSHDERLYTELTDRLTFSEYKKDFEERPPSEDYDPVQESLLDENAKQAIYAQLANKTGIGQQGKIIADEISRSIEKAARLFKQEGATEIIAKTIGTPSDNEDETCKTAALLIANACIMHKRLEETGNLGGLTQIAFANLTRNPSSALEGAWITILDKDYAPVFQDATALLGNLPQGNEKINEAIGALIQCAIDNATTLNELGFDHAGPLYHSVIGSAQSDGAYYTKNLSAYLLAGLAFDENFIDWKDADAVGNLKIIDPACGTGTLLMAALNIIKKRAQQAQNLDEAGVNNLHKRLVENAIYGFDINKYSVQLAACNLTIGAPNTDYDRMNLHTLIHGPMTGTDGDKSADVRHGALELLLGDKDKTNFGEIAMPPPPIYGKGVMRKDMNEVVMPKEFDVAIYNPPFTETLNQSTRFSKQTRDAMTERREHIKATLIKKNPAAGKAISKRSIQPFFTPLTTDILSNNGKLAKVIPATMCTAKNAREQRQYLADNFHIEMVVTSHDPKRINFSENTNIHECLVIGKRNKNHDKPTRFIQLATFPNNAKQAEKIIDEIQNGNGESYSETLWSADKVRDGNWSPVQWFNSKLARIADEMDDLPKLTSINETCSLSNAPISVRVNFSYKRSDDGNAFCTIGEDVMQTINAKPESKATPVEGKEDKAANVWEKATRFLIAARFSTTSSRLLSFYCKKPAIGSAYYSMATQTPEQEKAFSAFLNSSFGVIQMLNRRTKKLTYPSYEVGQIKTLMLPDPNKANLKPLLTAFEEIKNIPLQRLANCADDHVRKVLDYAAAEAIGFDAAVTDEWRELLSQEPTITNKKYNAN